MHKVMQLNTWCGRAGGFREQLFDMVTLEQPSIICLQEVQENELGNTLSLNIENCSDKTMMFQNLHRDYWKDFEIYFSPRVTTWPAGGNYSKDEMLGHWGNVIMWKRNLYTMVESQTKFIIGGHDTYDHKDDRTLPVNIQSVVLKNKSTGKNILVVNTHGWYGGKGFGKIDSPERIKQSESIVSYVESFGEIPVLLCGDFNIRIDSKSLRIIETYFGKNSNALKNFNIELTRTNLYGEEKRSKEPHASYVFTNSFIKQVSCAAYSESSISDHAPILLEFNY